MNRINDLNLTEKEADILSHILRNIHSKKVCIYESNSIPTSTIKFNTDAYEIYYKSDIDDRGNAFYQIVHELYHAYQMEEGYYTISMIEDTPDKVQNIIFNLNNFALDYDVYLRMNALNLSYKGTSEKYFVYKNKLESIINDNKKINSYFIKAVAIEISYMYLMDSLKNANELLIYANQINRKIVDFSVSIIKQSQQYKVSDCENYKKFISSLIDTIHFDKYCFLYQL